MGIIRGNGEYNILPILPAQVILVIPKASQRKFSQDNLCYLSTHAPLRRFKLGIIYPFDWNRNVTVFSGSLLSQNIILRFEFLFKSLFSIINY